MKAFLERHIIWLPFMIAIGLFLLTDVMISFTPVGQYLDDKVDNNLSRKLDNIRSDHPRQIDILALGTSRVNNGFKTETFEKSVPSGLNTYNMGLPGGSYYLIKLVLERHVHQYGKPKMVLLEVTDFLLNNDFVSTNNILYYRSILANQPELASEIFNSPYLSMNDKQEIVLASLSGLYRYRSILAPDILAKMVLKGKSKDNRYFQGWNPKKISKDMKSDRNVLMNAKARERRILSNYKQVDTERLENFLSYCQQENIPVVLFEYPSHPSYQGIFDRNAISRPYYEAVQKVVSEYHVPFVDLKKELPHNVEGLFADSGHLSPAGAELMSGILAHRVFENATVSSWFQQHATLTQVPAAVAAAGGR
ncbi:MAG: DUF1574 family protein [Candidatus Melainabacteria bacterium]